MRLSLLYRGPLSSCNYECGYCPFAKTRNSPEELARDQQCLERLVAWVEARPDIDLGLLFVPWGEAMIRPWYPEALTRLSWLPQVRKVAIQTNLSGGLDWLSGATPRTLAFWASYHPEEVQEASFLEQCQALHRGGFSFSVGAVGRREALPRIRSLRAQLPPEVYLWINAFRRSAPPLTPEEEEAFRSLDPLYDFNRQPQPSLTESCRTGEEVFSVDGEGQLRRCFFQPEVLGNLFQPGSLEAAQKPRPCGSATCHCHIGYVHLRPLHLYQVFGEGILERVPAWWPTPATSQDQSS